MTKIGVVGCGYWGSKHIRVFHQIPEAELAVVCDPRADRLSRVQLMYPAVATTQTYQLLLESDVDGVVIATPPNTHYKLAKQALSMGKDVLIEKPFTTNAEDARSLLHLAKAEGRVLMIGHTYQYHPAVEFLREYVASGQLGKVYYIDSARLNLGVFQSDVDVVWDLAPHDLSILLAILGENPTSISARGTAHINSKLYEVAYLDLMFPDNVLAHIHVSWLDPCKVRRVTLVGSEKMVVFDDLSESEPIRIYDKGVTIEWNGTDFDYPSVDYRYGDLFIPYIPMEEPLLLEGRHFVECIQDQTLPRSDGVMGYRIVQLLEAARKSINNEGAQEKLGSSLGGLDYAEISG